MVVVSFGGVVGSKRVVCSDVPSTEVGARLHHTRRMEMES
jgi:hypothetical protein